MEMEKPYHITWGQIKANLNNMTDVEGGFSLAHRGLVSLPEGQQVFVKIGTEENSKAWAQKEIAVYGYLAKQSYPAIPELLSTDETQTSFALEALSSEEGWDWKDTWTTERLAATLKAMDQLAALRPKNENWLSMGQLALDESRNGWLELNRSSELQQALLVKLRAADHAGVAETLDFKSGLQRSSQFVFRTDTLVHYDVRADNCAWNVAKNQVKLVDWNWTQYGDTRIDNAALLTHVQKSGMDISKTHAARLDADALHWMAGFWLKAAASPIWPGGPPHLRDFQLEAGVTALSLANKV
jgi:hypothetical protein